MLVKELIEKIEELRVIYPNIDDIEIGPLFNGDLVMMISDLTIEEGSGWETDDAIGIIWNC